MIQSFRKSVRPYIAVLFATAFVAGFIMKLITAETFVGVVGSVIGYYFNSRENSKKIKE